MNKLLILPMMDMICYGYYDHLREISCDSPGGAVHGGNTKKYIFK